jgi:hypothetical protein
MSAEPDAAFSMFDFQVESQVWDSRLTRRVGRHLADRDEPGPCVGENLRHDAS